MVWKCFTFFVPRVTREAASLNRRTPSLLQPSFPPRSSRPAQPVPESLTLHPCAVDWEIQHTEIKNENTSKWKDQPNGTTQNLIHTHKYNKFSKEIWKILNPPLQYTNSETSIQHKLPDKHSQYTKQGTSIAMKLSCPGYSAGWNLCQRDFCQQVQ